jgi:protein SCO1
MRPAHRTASGRAQGAAPAWPWRRPLWAPRPLRTRGAALLLLAALAALAVAPAALRAHDGDAPAGATARPAAVQAPATAATDDLPGSSLYLLDSHWRSDRGALESIASLRGRPVVLAMIYASCEHSCPVIVADMQRIAQALSPAQRERVTFALFSFDPARDTPAAMAAFRRQHGLEGADWRLFSGNPDAVLELAAVLNVKYRPDGFGGFSHSTLITVLDADGVIRHQQAGVNQPPDETLAALRPLLGG